MTIQLPTRAELETQEQEMFVKYIEYIQQRMVKDFDYTNRLTRWKPAVDRPLMYPEEKVLAALRSWAEPQGYSAEVTPKGVFVVRLDEVQQ